MCDLVFSCFVVSGQGLKHAACMWPTRALYAARDAFW